MATARSAPACAEVSSPGDRLALAEAMCARVCHDLAGPLGTVMAMLDLAGEDPAAAAEALAIGGEGLHDFGLRLRLLRAAWAGACPAMTLAELQELAGALPARITPDLSLLPAALEGQRARLVLNLLLLAVDALPRGGRVRVALRGDCACAEAAGRSAAWPQDEAGAGFQWVMVLRLAQDAGLRLALTADSSPG